jgi:hypothetical protein
MHFDCKPDHALAQVGSMHKRHIAACTLCFFYVVIVANDPLAPMPKVYQNLWPAHVISVSSVSSVLNHSPLQRTIIQHGGHGGHGE